jgi:hypothetical protein
LSPQDSLLLEVTAEKDALNLIEYSLQNMGIVYFVESQTPYRIRIPAYPVVIAVILTILEEKYPSMTGKVTLPDGAVYQINPEDLKEIRKRTIAKLGATPSVNPLPSQQGGNVAIEIFREAMKDPEATGKLVREISSALRGDPQVALEETKQVSRFTLAIMGLMAIVIIGVTVLSLLGRVSGDTVGIVYGTVLGSSFAFLYKYLDFPETSNA